MRISCQHCGGRVEIPASFSRAKIRCPGCGYYTEVPEEHRSQVPDEGRTETPPERRSPPPSPPPPTSTTKAAPVLARPLLAAPTEPPPAPEEKPPTSNRRPSAFEPADEEPYGLSEPEKPATPPAPRRERTAKSRKAAPQADPRDHRARFETDEETGKPLLEGTQDEDDDRPYALPGTGLKQSPNCRGELPLDADFCVHCGREIRTGAKAVRSFQPIDRTWIEGWSSLFRIQVFIVLQIFNLAAALALLITGSGLPTDLSGFITVLSGQLFQVALQAFLVGSYDTLIVKRNSKGSATITRIRKIAFYPLPPNKLPWKKSTNIGIAGADVGWFPKLLCIYFALDGFLYGIMGIFFSFFMLGLSLIYLATAVGFYWIVLRPNRFEVNLCDVYGSTDEVVFRCQNREESEDIAKTIADATGLFYKPAL